MAKLFLILGLVFLFLSAVLYLDLYRFFPLGRLPGDIIIRKEGVSFYFPLTSCFVVSVIFYFVSKYLN